MDVSNRNTVSKRLAELDSLYVYHTRHEVKKIHQRHQPGEGYRYKNHKAVIKALEGEIYIYHQTFAVDGVKKGLTLVTKEKRKTKVADFFKESVELIKNDAELSTIFKTAKPSPKELGIYYLAK